MGMMRRVWMRLILAVCLLISGCNLPQATLAPGADLSEPSSISSATSPAATPTYIPLPTVIPDTGWQALQPGLERRIILLQDDGGARLERIYLVRLEPEQFVFNVAYHPQPLTLQEWQAETGALLVINGGYFRQEGDLSIPTGLSVVDGETMGSTYGDFAGMLAVTADGPDLRWLAQRPYDPNEALSAALQSFPLLIKPGGELGFPAENEDNQAARRTAVAHDRQGRGVVIVAQLGYFTLHQFSAYLAGSDLDLDIALNLDGGPSSGLFLADPAEQVPAFSALPIVITVSKR
jgi:uncharacterized protein YigE (DUF2233 family)